MKFEIAELAQREVDEAIDFYFAQAGRQVAHSFIKELDRAWDLLLQHPKLGKPTNGNRRIWHLNTYPYSVVYSVRDDTLLILVVAHQRRDPAYWQSRQ